MEHVHRKNILFKPFFLHMAKGTKLFAIKLELILNQATICGQNWSLGELYLFHVSLC